MPERVNCRNANTNPALPLRYDAQQLVDRILRTLSEAATAARTLAQREENRIYCWYEGWLPDQEDLPTQKWEHAWLDSGLVRGTLPTVTPTRPPLAAHLAPSFDVRHPGVTARIWQTRPSYQPPSG